MARHFGPIAVPKSIEPWLYNALNRLNEASEQSSAGLAAIDRGEAPNGSGSPLIPDLTSYFYKPGLQGGQLAYGALEASGFLKLSSTANATKGKIYLGTALTTAYDELNNRIGIGTASPSAKLHVKGEPASNQIGVPLADTNIGTGTWTHTGSGLFAADIAEQPAGSSTQSITCASSNASWFRATTLTDPGVAQDANWTVSVDYQVNGTVPVTVGLCDAGGNTYASLSCVSPANPVANVRATMVYTVPAAVVAAIRAATAFNLIHIRIVRGAGTVIFYDVWITAPSASGATAGAGGSTALFDADSAQTADNTQWRTSDGTSLISITAGGRLTVESGGSMRFVPSAGADKLMASSNSSGDLALVTVSGDLTQTGGVFTIANNAVTFAKMADVATARFIGRITAGTGDPEALTGTQATTLLDVFTTSLKGLVPSGGSNTTFLRGDATWQTLTDAGWTDAGTVVRLNTSTDQVGIGTSSPGASLGIENVNATSDIVLKVKGKASQSGSLISVQNSSSRNLFSVGPTGSIQIGNTTDTGNILVTFAGSVTSGPSKNIITWGDNLNNLGTPATTADTIGCTGARFYPYKDPTGVYDMAYGQSELSAWVLISDETVTYDFWTGEHPGSPFLRCSWAGNGDLTNYGLIHIRKSLGANTPGTPQLRLEETGAGTDYISLRAPSSVTANRTQLLFNMNGTIPLVGDDPPAVAAGAMGKVDSTAQAAAIASTNLTNGALAGYYLVQYYLEVTTADAGAVSVQFQINHTDDIGATNQTGAVLALTATGRDRGQFQVYVASGELSYQTNVVTIGTARYALRVRVIYLG